MSSKCFFFLKLSACSNLLTSAVFQRHRSLWLKNKCLVKPCRIVKYVCITRFVQGNSFWCNIVYSSIVIGNIERSRIDLFILHLNTNTYKRRKILNHPWQIKSYALLLPRVWKEMTDQELRITVTPCREGDDAWPIKTTRVNNTCR